MRGLSDVTHRCDTEDCPTLAEQTKNLNSYLIDLLLGEGIISNWSEVLLSDKKASDSEIYTSKIELDNVLLKHKLEIDQKIAACSIEINEIRTKVNTMETVQNKLINDMDEIKNTQTAHHTANTQMHENTAKLLQQLLDLNVANDQQAKIKVNSKTNQKQSSQLPVLSNKLQVLPRKK